MALLDHLPRRDTSALPDDMRAWQEGLSEMLRALPFWEALCVQASAAGGSVEALRRGPLPGVARALIATTLRP